MVVIVTPDFDRTAAALDAAGMPFRRVRDAGGFRQGFRRLGPAILELVESQQMPPGPARFWGLTLIASDLDAARGAPPARTVAAARQRKRSSLAGGSRRSIHRRGPVHDQRVAFMTPEPEGRSARPA